MGNENYVSGTSNIILSVIAHLKWHTISEIIFYNFHDKKKNKNSESHENHNNISKIILYR